MEEKRIIRKLKLIKNDISPGSNVAIVEENIQSVIDDITKSPEKENPEITININKEVDIDAEKLGKALKRYLRQGEVI